jgi:hypothetical protein
VRHVPAAAAHVLGTAHGSDGGWMYSIFATLPPLCRHGRADIFVS